MNQRTDLINHQYFILFEISEFETKSKGQSEEREFINMYDNLVAYKYISDGNIHHIRRTIQDVNKKLRIYSRVRMSRVINVTKLIWNPNCRQIQNALVLEELIDQLNLLMNDKLRQFIFPTSQRVSVMYLTFTKSKLGFLTFLKIFKEYRALSNHELQVL